MLSNRITRFSPFFKNYTVNAPDNITALLANRPVSLSDQNLS